MSTVAAVRALNQINAHLGPLVLGKCKHVAGPPMREGQCCALYVYDEYRPRDPHEPFRMAVMEPVAHRAIVWIIASEGFPVRYLRPGLDAQAVVLWNDENADEVSAIRVLTKAADLIREGLINGWI